MDTQETLLKNPIRGYAYNPIPAHVWNGTMSFIMFLATFVWLGCAITIPICLFSHNICEYEASMILVMVETTLTILLLGRAGWSFWRTYKHYETNTMPYNYMNVCQKHFCCQVKTPEYIVNEEV